MSESDVSTFVREYEAAWASSDSADFAHLWHTAGVLRHPLLSEPVSGEIVPAFTDYVRAARPGLRWQLDRWAARGNIVFLEWTANLAVDGVALAWSGVDRMVLRDNRIAEEVVYSDTLRLWAARDPTMRRPAMIDARALAGGVADT